MVQKSPEMGYNAPKHIEKWWCHFFFRRFAILGRFLAPGSGFWGWRAGGGLGSPPFCSTSHVGCPSMPIGHFQHPLSHNMCFWPGLRRPGSVFGPGKRFLELACCWGAGITSHSLHKPCWEALNANKALPTPLGPTICSFGRESIASGRFWAPGSGFWRGEPGSPPIRSTSHVGGPTRHFQHHLSQQYAPLAGSPSLRVGFGPREAVSGAGSRDHLPFAPEAMLGDLYASKALPTPIEPQYARLAGRPSLRAGFWASGSGFESRDHLPLAPEAMSWALYANGAAPEPLDPQYAHLAGSPSFRVGRRFLVAGRRDPLPFAPEAVLGELYANKALPTPTGMPCHFHHHPQAYPHSLSGVPSKANIPSVFLPCRHPRARARASCLVPSAKCQVQVQSAKCKVLSAKCTCTHARTQYIYVSMQPPYKEPLCIAYYFHKWT